MNLTNTIKFIHANGFPPLAYQTLFTLLENKTTIDSFYLRPLDKNLKNTVNKLKNWETFSYDFIKTLNFNEKIIGMGHSIGGNIILRTAIRKPKYFSKLILLDPTLFIPTNIYLWKIIEKLRLQNKVHPWVKATLNRKMVYNDFNEIYNSYRKKKVFLNISDENLKIYINSITKTQDDKKLHIIYSKEWEHKIYKTGLIADMYIWRNIKKVTLPTLIIRAEESTAFYDSAANKIKKMNNSNIDIITIKKSSHLFPLEKPEETSKKILSFITQ